MQNIHIPVIHLSMYSIKEHLSSPNCLQRICLTISAITQFFLRQFWAGVTEYLQHSTVNVCSYHVSPALRHCPTVLFRLPMKPLLSRFGVPIKGKHSLQILNVIKDVSSKTSLKVPLRSVVGSRVFVDAPALMGMSILTKYAKIFDNVIETKGGRLVVTLSVFALFFLSE